MINGLLLIPAFRKDKFLKRTGFIKVSWLPNKFSLNCDEIFFSSTFYLGFLWENVQIRFGYFLSLDPLVTAPRSVTKSDSGCYYVAITSIPGFPRTRIETSQSSVCQMILKELQKKRPKSNKKLHRQCKKKAHINIHALIVYVDTNWYGNTKICN